MRTLGQICHDSFRTRVLDDDKCGVRKVLFSYIDRCRYKQVIDRDMVKRVIHIYREMRVREEPIRILRVRKTVEWRTRYVSND